MNDFEQMRIFFFITSVAAVILAVLLAVLAGYIIGIARDIKYISRRAREEVDLVSEDLIELRKNVRERGAKLKYFWSFFNSVYQKYKKKG